ncbi:hypothetical protein N8009_03765 [Flavobacteriaceae bacterium]|nr:hypothetical protein [Flavobacteriaceae bacterium]
MNFVKEFNPHYRHPLTWGRQGMVGHGSGKIKDVLASLWSLSTT